MNTIAHDNENSKYISERNRSFFKACGLSEALQKSNCYKEKGISVAVIIEYLFSLVFRNRSAYADVLLVKPTLRKTQSIACSILCGQTGFGSQAFYPQG